MKIRCLDCYEENDPRAERCIRCGRLLEDARKQSGIKFESQHQDAPGIIKKGNDPRKVW